MKNIQIITICGAMFILSGCQQPLNNYGQKPQSYPYNTSTQVVEVNNSTSSSSASSTTPSSPTRRVAKTTAEAVAVKDVTENSDSQSAQQPRSYRGIPAYSEGNQ